MKVRIQKPEPTSHIHMVWLKHTPSVIQLGLGHDNGCIQSNSHADLKIKGGLEEIMTSGKNRPETKPLHKVEDSWMQNRRCSLGNLHAFSG
jgi:hypothetical protein